MDFLHKRVLGLGDETIVKIKDEIKDLIKNTNLRYKSIKSPSLNKLKKVSIERVLNLIYSEIARRFGIFISEIHPVGFFLEVVRGCNFKCIMCSAWKFPKSLISYEQAKRILPHFRKALTFHAYGIGEPFLNRDIYDIVKYASEKLKFITYITSNFSVINPEKALNMGADEIMASIDSTDPKNFFEIRKGNFELVKRNIKILMQMKGRRKYPVISIRTVISKNNIDELENIIKFGISLNIRKFYFQTLVEGNLCSKTNDVDTNDIYKIYDVINRYKRETEITVVSYRHDFKGDVPEGYCPVAFSLASIDYRGNLYPCYRVIDDNDASFGNIFSDPQKALKNRNIFLKKFTHSPTEFCKNCECYIRNFKNKGNFNQENFHKRMLKNGTRIDIKRI